MVRELESYGVKVYVHDAVAESDEAMHEYGVALTAWDALPKAAAVVVAVSHAQYREMGVEAIARKLQPGAVFVDVKASFDPTRVEQAGMRLWRL